MYVSDFHFPVDKSTTYDVGIQVLHCWQDNATQQCLVDGKVEVMDVFEKFGCSSDRHVAWI